MPRAKILQNEVESLKVSSVTQSKKKKRSSLSKKLKKSKHEILIAEEESDTEELREPTVEELTESTKTENTFSVESIRKKKKERHLKKLDEQKEANVRKDDSKNEKYLRTWLNNRSQWKFEKLRQISVQTSIFDENKINEELFPIAVQYLSGTKGAAKAKLISLAEKEIEIIDEEMEKSGKKDQIASGRYIRARELLQLLG